MATVQIKPLSVNQCWQGRRFKTKAYQSYEKEMILRLKKEKLPEPPFKIVVVFGFSNKASDIDNPLKPLLDIVQKKYKKKFNDKDIYQMIIYKQVVKKGKEFVRFAIYNIDD